MKSAFFFFDDDTLDEEDDDDDAVEEDLFVFFLSSTGISRQCSTRCLRSGVVPFFFDFFLANIIS